MKKTIISICASVITLCISCNNQNNSTVDINIDNFSKIENLEGRSIIFDTIPGVFGGVASVDSLYLFYLYRSDNFIMVTDNDFNTLGYTARRGSGPGEVSQISFLYGDILDSGDIGILDIDKHVVYRSELNHFGELTPTLNLSTLDNVPAPVYLQKMNNGNYVMAHLDYEYGLYTYNPSDNSVNYWPIGMDLPKSKKHDISSGRWICYNSANDITSEFYSSLPILILHDGKGEVIRTLQYDDMPSVESINEDSPTLIAHACLTNNCIFTLLGEGYSPDSETDVRPIIVTDYNGLPISRLNIKRADSFCIDVANRRLIAVNPNEDESITIYDIPDWIVL